MKTEKEEVRTEKERTKTPILSYVIVVIVVGLCIFIYSRWNKIDNTAETPTVGEIINIHEHTVYEKSISTGLCHEVTKLRGENGKFFLRSQSIDCDKLKNIKVIETP